MDISFDEIENAFFFVSMDQQYTHNAYLCKETGRIYYTSEMGDSDELPEDIDDPKYISIPHRNELDLGKELVNEFTLKFLSEDRGKVDSIFRSRGAYSRYKVLLAEKGLLDQWYEFEDNRVKTALKEWCAENDIVLVG